MQINPERMPLMAWRAEFEETIGSGQDAIYSNAQIAAKLGISESDIITVFCEGARPKVSWSEVNPICYFNTANSMFGVHNNGTGGVAITTFVAICKN